MKRILTYGTFDLLHYGHIRLLQRAKALGDYFIVARDSKNGVVDINGKSVIELKYDSISRNNETNILQAETNKSIELYNLNMKKITTMSNATIKEVKDDKEYILLYSENDFKYLDKDGNI